MTDRPGYAARDVTIITPWYPTPQFPFRGSFVRAMVAATAPACDTMTVIHCNDLVTSVTESEDVVMRAAAPKVAAMVEPALDRFGVPMLQLSVPIPSKTGYAEIARRQAETVRAALRGEPISSRVIHAHVGLPGGWVALANAAPDARVYVTEHAGYLDSLLSDPEARAMYDEVIDRADGFFAVGEAVRQSIVAALPHHATKIRSMPNPIDFDHPRERPVTDLRRWLFVGNLLEGKGVRLLLEAFAKCHDADPSRTLTFVGEGPLAQPLAERAAELGVADAVTFAGPQPPDEMAGLLAEHDLLVHPSRGETFGMTIIEAIAVGTPVLVTRCGGPQETLAGIETAASEFIDVTDSPADIVDGYRRLCERVPDGLDMALAQRTLAARYSYATVRDIYERVWFPESAPRGPHAQTARMTKADDPAANTKFALILAVGGHRQRDAYSGAATLLAAGARVMVVVSKAAWYESGLPAGVEIFELPFVGEPKRPFVDGSVTVPAPNPQHTADRRTAALVAELEPGSEPDLVVVTDPRSMLVAVPLIRALTARTWRGRIAFGLPTHVKASKTR